MAYELPNFLDAFGLGHPFEAATYFADEMFLHADRPSPSNRNCIAAALSGSTAKGIKGIKTGGRGQAKDIIRRRGAICFRRKTRCGIQ
jgi:hypothetical protein